MEYLYVIVSGWVRDTTEAILVFKNIRVYPVVSFEFNWIQKYYFLFSERRDFLC